MADLDGKFNAIVLVVLCAAGYYYFSQPREYPAPPDDQWFRASVIDRPEPVLVKFGAEWCGPCRNLDPELDKLAEAAHGRMSIVRVNVDEHRELASHYGVSAIPRLLLFHNGKVIADRVGGSNEKQLENWIVASAK
jgi:thioredoxin 1